jgi:hypothetical protein
MQNSGLAYITRFGCQALACRQIQFVSFKKPWNAVWAKDVQFVPTKWPFT